MGLDINITGAYSSAIDKKAFAGVSEKIFNPNGEKTVDFSKIDFSKFNRASLGTDLYAAKTNGELALKAAKAVTDFDVKLGNQFNNNIQYLNSQAAQSILNSQDLGQKNISVDVNNAALNERDTVILTTKTTETQDLNKDKRGENPFAFFLPAEQEDTEDEDSLLSAISIFA